MSTRKSLGGHRVLFLLDRYLRVKLLGHMMSICLVL